MTMTPRQLLKLDSMPTEEVARHLDESLRWIKDNKADVRAACMPYLEQSCPHLYSISRAVGEVADDLDDYAHFIFQVGYLKGIQKEKEEVAKEWDKAGLEMAEARLEEAKAVRAQDRAIADVHRLEYAVARILRNRGHKVTWREELEAKGEGECQA